jgi:hypothetical protein
MSERLEAAPPTDGERQTLDTRMLREAVREEVRSGLAESLPKAPEAPSAVAGATRDPHDLGHQDDESENLEPTPGYVTAMAKVEERISRGSWTNDAREQVSSVLGKMTDAERAEVMKRVITEVNRGTIRVEVQGPLFQ